MIFNRFHVFRLNVTIDCLSSTGGKVPLNPISDRISKLSLIRPIDSIAKRFLCKHSAEIKSPIGNEWSTSNDTKTRLPSTTKDSKNEQFVVKTLKKYFRLESKQIEDIFKNFPYLKEFNVSDLQNRISLLTSKELCLPEVALKRTWVLTTPMMSLRSGLRLLEKEELLKKISDGKSYILVMFLFDKKTYKLFSKRFAIKKNLFSDFDERLELFRQNLDINSDMFCAIAKENYQILNKDINHIKRVMDILKDNICKEDLISDHWIFIHNISRIEKRVKESKELGRPLMPWNLRCPDSVWYALIERWRHDAQALGDDDIVSYLMKKLKCDRKDIENLIVRSPRTFRVRPGKLDQVISLLYENGYSSSDILKCPRVLNYSPQRIVKRIGYSGNKKPSLSQILVTKKQLKKS